MEPELKAYLDNISSHLLAGMAAMETRLGERIDKRIQTIPGSTYFACVT